MDDGCKKSESTSKQTRGGHGGGGGRRRGYNERFEEVLLDGCHYRIYGNNNTTPTTNKKNIIPTVCVFFIPGFGDTSAGFDPFILSLVENNDDDAKYKYNNNNNHFKAITMDLPGCGSNFDTMFNDVDEIIGWIINVLEREALDKNIIIGHSLGGLFALRAMGKIISNCDDIIPSIIRVDGCYLIEATILDSDRIFFESLDIKCIDPVKKFVSLLDSSMVPEEYLSQYKQNVSRMSSRMFCLYTTNVIQFLQQSEHKKLLSSLMVSIPISYVYGEESPSQSDREILPTKYTNMSTKKFINTAHWPHIDVQQDVISHFQTFLNEVVF